MRSWLIAAAYPELTNEEGSAAQSRCAAFYAVGSADYAGDAAVNGGEMLRLEGHRAGIYGGKAWILLEAVFTIIGGAVQIL
eukprot:3400251-Rhodomonas_salina.1